MGAFIMKTTFLVVSQGRVFIYLIILSFQTRKNNINIAFARKKKAAAEKEMHLHIVFHCYNIEEKTAFFSWIIQLENLLKVRASG